VQSSQGETRIVPSPIRKVLIYRLGSLGDTIVALPCLHLIARLFPDAQRMLLTNFPVHTKAPAAAAVLGDSGLVQGYLRYTVGTRNPGELLRLVGQIRRFDPDLLIYLMPVRLLRHVQRDRRFFQTICGVRRIEGLPGQDELIHRLDPATGLYESEASRLARTLAALGDAHPEDPAQWDLHLTAGEEAAAAQALGGLAERPLIVCAPGCKMQANDWGRENWRELLGRLSARYPNYVLVLAGAGEDAELCAEVARDWKGEKLNLAGRLRPRESAAVFRRAEVFMGPDSGPKHLAGAVGTSCVCVFSARGKPGVWFPPGDRKIILFRQPDCQGCGLETCIAMERKCLRAVGVEEVEAAVMRMLGG